jgi:IclR family acetate operon transcriptional repressor
VFSGDEAVCMAQIESRQAMRAISGPGGRVRLHMSGAGKALLACLPEPEVDRIADKGLPRATERTLVSLPLLKSELRTIRARGFAVDDEEYATGLRCVAVPLLDERGTPLAALSLSGPTARVSDSRLAGFGAQVMDASRATAADLGGRSTFT